MLRHAMLCVKVKQTRNREFRKLMRNVLIFWDFFWNSRLQRNILETSKDEIASIKCGGLNMKEKQKKDLTFTLLLTV